MMNQILEQRPFQTARGSLDFDFGLSYGLTPNVLSEGSVRQAPKMEGIMDETRPPNMERQSDSQVMFNGVYYQPWPEQVKPLFQGSRMTPPINYNRLSVGTGVLKRGVDRGSTMIDEEGKLVHVANYASNFRLKGAPMSELRRSFLIQSLNNLNNKPSVRARRSIINELKSRGMYTPEDEERPLSELKAKIDRNVGRNGMPENPWTEDPVFAEIQRDMEQAEDDGRMSDIQRQQQAILEEIQQMNQQNQQTRVDSQGQILRNQIDHDILQDGFRRQAEEGQFMSQQFDAQQQGGDTSLTQEFTQQPAPLTDVAGNDYRQGTFRDPNIGAGASSSQVPSSTQQQRSGISEVTGAIDFEGIPDNYINDSENIAQEISETGEPMDWREFQASLKARNEGRGLNNTQASLLYNKLVKPVSERVKKHIAERRQGRK